MAVIVEYSNNAVKEKIAAWQKIIDECPDMPIRGNEDFKPRKSLHRYLKWWIAKHEKWIANFFADGEGKAIFRPYPYLIGNEFEKSDGYLETSLWDIGCYSTLEKALSAVRRYANDMEFAVSKAIIYKTTIDKSDDREISALFNSKGELLKIFDFLGGKSGNNRNELENVLIHLPIPFEKGDIVMEDDGMPYVLLNAPSWDKDWCEKMQAKNNIDFTDRCGYAVGLTFGYEQLASNHPCVYHLQYYKKELQGHERFLESFSKYVKKREKGEDNDWSAVALIDSFCKRRAEAVAEDTVGLM